MTTNTGHCCTRLQLEHVLRVCGCDTDAEGRFCVDGTIVSFMGAGEEFVVGPDAVYYRGGQACSLAVALRGTSYGFAAEVI